MKLANTASFAVVPPKAPLELEPMATLDAAAGTSCCMLPSPGKR